MPSALEEMTQRLMAYKTMPALNLVAGDTSLQAFYGAMAARPSTAEILAAQEAECDQTRREIFEDFGKAYADMLTPAKAGLSALFGHEV